MNEQEMKEWKGAVAVAWVGSGTGVVRIESATVLAVQEDLVRLRRVADAAQAYFERYMRDEADDDMGVVCDRDQHTRAVELRDALAAINVGIEPPERSARMTG